MDISYFQHPLRTLRNKYYADLLRSKWYAKQVEKNPRRAVNIKWLANHHKLFPWDNPQTLDEKIAWLQVNSDTTEWSRLADKYEVRNYVKEKVGEDYLVPCYGMWNKVQDIDFESLPKQFVIKCTHDCGSTIIVKNKYNINQNEIKERLQQHLIKKIGHSTFEPHYTKIKHRVMAEQLLPPNQTTGSIIDYKIWCLEGEPYLWILCYDREINGHPTVDIYEANPWHSNRKGLSKQMMNQHFIEIPEPPYVDEMIDIARTLSKGFHAVRIDLYNINGKIYFGEMTFTGAAGDHYYFSEQLKLNMGKHIILSKC